MRFHVYRIVSQRDDERHVEHKTGNENENENDNDDDELRNRALPTTHGGTLTRNIARSGLAAPRTEFLLGLGRCRN